MEKGVVNKASCSFAFGLFKRTSHNKALQVPFSLGLFFIFLGFPVALRVVDKKKNSIKQQTSKSYVATRHWNQCRGSMPLTIYQETVTFAVNIRLLVSYCFDMPLSCLHVQVYTLGRLALDDFSMVRVDRLKFCCIIPSGVDLQ